MFGFFIFGAAFVIILTLIARFAPVQVRRPIPDSLSAFLTAAFIASILFGWWFVTKGDKIEDRIVNPIILPSPVEVVMAFPTLHFQQGLIRSAWASFMRILLGFSMASVVAVSLGVYMASFTSIRAFFKPLALATSYIPVPVFIPLTLAWWGADETQKIGFLFIACFVALLPLVIKSISDVSDSYLDVAVTKGASQWQLVRHVLFPIAAADIWDHMRGIYGVGWGWIILAEVVNAQIGLGHLITVSERRTNTPAIYAIIIVIVLIAILCDKAWQYGGMALFPHRKRHS
jgi:NitT/TauT family transport system permease protein